MWGNGKGHAAMTGRMNEVSVKLYFGIVMFKVCSCECVSIYTMPHMRGICFISFAYCRCVLSRLCVSHFIISTIVHLIEYLSCE